MSEYGQEVAVVDAEHSESLARLVGAGTRILVVDDEPSVRLYYRVALQPLNFVVDTAADGEQAIALLRENEYELIITDLMMPRKNGFDVLHAALELDPSQIVIVATSFSSLDNAIHAVEQGAYSFIAKPFGQKQLEIDVAKALAFRRLTQANRELTRANENLRKQLKATYAFDQIVGTSRGMQDVFRIVERIAASDARVLIYGGSGTGKELIARAVHTNSKRADEPFVAVNCGAIPETLIESELFGHEKGAFTGATAQKKGLIEEAEGGTLFLDEVSEMAMAVQVKFLRFLQEGTFRRVGSSREMTANVRVIAATNRQPEDAVKDDKLREDLFYRLNVIRINLPPLSERPEDIRPLALHFVQKHAKRQGKEFSRVEPRAMQYLEGREWPGNVRELENTVERAVALAADDVITIEDLTGNIGQDASTATAGMPFHSEMIDLDVPFQEARDQAREAFDKAYLQKLLHHYSGNVSRAAEASGFDRRSLQRLIARYEIPIEEIRKQ